MNEQIALHKAEWERDGLYDKVKNENRMQDLHATYKDATAMADFLYNVICLDIRDITIMSDQMDCHRLFPKPEFQGDFLKQMFDWNLNKKEAEMKTKELHKALSE